MRERTDAQGPAWARRVRIREWHPRFAASTDEEIRRAPFTRDDARLVYAREHGFENWPAFMAHVEAVARGDRSEPFRDAFEALRRREWDRLAELLRAHPDLIRARGTNGNTLLNLAVSLAGRTCDALPPQAWAALDAFLIAGRDEAEVLQALHRTQQVRPDGAPRAPRGARELPDDPYA